MATGYAAPALDEPSLKAAFVRNFAEFVTWPVENHDGVIRLCVAGTDDLGAALDALEGKRIRDMTLTVRRHVSGKNLAQCQIVFLPASASTELHRVVEAIRGRPVLLVAEAEGLAALGASISFVFRPGGLLGFDVNVEAAGANDLKIGSRLLMLARRVY